MPCTTSWTKPIAAVRRPVPSRRKTRCCLGRASSVKTPSSSTSADVLEKLQNYTTLLEDNALDIVTKARDEKSSAALVNFALLSHILANTSAFSGFANAIEKGVALAGADQPREALSDEAETVALDQAIANVCGMLRDTVLGRIAVEVDPRLANDEEALHKRASSLLARLHDSGLQRDKLLLQLPGTWAGIAAAKRLESDGAQCQITHVYTFAQAVAAVKAGASVLVMNITHVNLWYDNHPGAIRDPKAPRQDASGDGKVNVGVRTAAAVYSYAQQQGGKTRVIVTGLRTEDEALRLSGIDYMVMPKKIAEKLQQQSTLQGYNDGFSATASESDADAIPQLSDKYVSEHQFAEDEVADVDEKEFESELGMAGLDLLDSKLMSDVKAANQVSELVRSVVVARE